MSFQTTIVAALLATFVLIVGAACGRGSTDLPDRADDLHRLQHAATPLHWADDLNRLKHAALKVVDMASNDEEQSMALNVLGDVYVAQGSLSEALSSYESSLALAESQIEADPDNIEWQQKLSVSLIRVGDVYMSQGNFSAARSSYQRSLALAESQIKADPNNTEWQQQLLVSLTKVGDVYVSQDNLLAARFSYERGAALAESLIEADPDNIEWESQLLISLSKVAGVYQTQGKLRAARSSYERGSAISTRISKRLVETYPGNEVWQRHISISLTNYSRNLAITKLLAEADPDNADLQDDLSRSLEREGDVYITQNNLPAALSSYERSLAITKRLFETYPDNAIWQRNLVIINVKLADLTDDNSHNLTALGIVLAMDEKSILAPNDRWMIDQLKIRAGQQ